MNDQPTPPPMGPAPIPEPTPEANAITVRSQKRRLATPLFSYTVYVCVFTDKMLKYLQLRVGTGGWIEFL